MAVKNKIIAFCCENSACKAVDSLGSDPVLDSLKIVKMPCSGKVEVGLILKCLEDGHLGVLVLGCPIDNCKYIKGSCRALKRIEVAKQALKNAGIDENRIRMDFISSLDSHKLVQIVKEMKKIFI